MNMSAEERAELELLRVFYQKVALLTIDHDVVDDNAVVFPSRLGPLLEKVDADWVKKSQQWEKRKWPRPKRRVRSANQMSTPPRADKKKEPRATHPMAQR